MASHRMSNNTDDLSPEEEAENVQYDRTADVSNQDDETAERAIDKDLKWTSRKPDPGRKLPALERPILVPQAAPGLASLFQRAWAPELLRHDIQPEEWTQFVDHLNICKTGSPPLQVLNLAGNVAGFVPNHWAQLAGVATNVVAIGGMVTVSRVRISRYLKRANAEFFVPRGLVARIVKQNNVHELTGQSPDAPMLIDLAATGVDPSTSPDIIERRMQAFGNTIAPLEHEDLPAKQQEQSTLDRMTAKMNAMKANRGSKTAADGTKVSKEQAKLEKARKEREEEAAELRQKAEKKIAKKPKDTHKVQKDLEKDLAKLGEDAQSDEEKYAEKSGKGGKKMEKKMKRLMFIGVQSLEEYTRQQEQQQRQVGV